MDRSKPTTHLNNGGKPQNVDVETQRFSEGKTTLNEHGELLQERLKSLGMSVDLSKWKRVNDLTSEREVDAIVNAMTGKPTPLDEAENLPLMAKYEDKAKRINTYDLMNNFIVQRAAAEQSYDAMLAKCAERGYEPKKERKMSIILGLPSSGKSTVLDERYLNAEGGYVECDSDLIKGCDALKEWYQDGTGAGAVAPISAEIQLEIMGKMMEEGYNLAIPMVSRNRRSTIGILQLAKSMGYSIDVVTKKEDPKICASRLVKRFAETGRYVSIGYLRTCAIICPTVYDSFKREFRDRGTIGGIEINGYESI